MEIHLLLPAYEGKESSLFPPLSLAALAAMTPEGHEVTIKDENVEALDIEKIPHLVGLTAMTPWATRSYQLAKDYQRLGSQVVMGGPHATSVPFEVKNYVDAVIIGEAQGLWPKVVEDARRRSLKPFYFHQTPPSQEGLPFPRRDLYQRGYGFYNTLSTSRGCPRRCFFCPAPSPSFRPIEEVIEEVERLKGKSLFFTDDNLAASPRRTRKLFRELIPLKKRWVGQASPEIPKGDLLDVAAESGCQGLFLGFHRLQREEHREIIKRAYGSGIPVVGDFIFGFDDEGEEAFKEVVDFVQEEGLTAARFSILTPFPGTAYYRELFRDGRIALHHPSSYNGRRFVFAPRSIEGEELIGALQGAYQEVYSWSSMARRFLRGPGGISFFLSQNRDLRKRWV